MRSSPLPPGEGQGVRAESAPKTSPNIRLMPTALTLTLSRRERGIKICLPLRQPRRRPTSCCNWSDASKRLPDFAEVVDSLQAGHAATLDGVWGSSCALVAAALARAAPAVLVIVCPRLDEVQGLIGDLSLFSPLEPLRFPVHESLSCRSGWSRTKRSAIASACSRRCSGRSRPRCW